MTYIDHHESRPNGYASCAVVVTHSWHDHTRANLAQRYGPERADRIMSGNDPKTQMDRQAWNQLGRRSAA